jgi:crotonobetainyl-CoA:carnitine CoA-transferase CaiB-like acyl-CoA transferase
MASLPLDGCRVLDLGIITAGAATSALLADLGAEVIKVESPTYRDPFRVWTEPGAPADRMPPFFRATNRNKAGISIDLKHSEGREAFLRLVRHSDVVVENFRRGVLGRFGLGYDALSAANPDIVLASISSQGETGPDAGYVSYGSTLEAVSGLAWAGGYPDGGPVVSGRDLNYPDQVVAIFAAGMIATAWRACRAGAGGTHLDLSQRELTSFLLGEAFVSPEDAVRQGNAQPPHRLQDCFRDAAGRWVAVTVDDRDLTALDRLLALPAGSGEAARRAALAAWIAGRDGAAVVGDLAALSIAAAPVLGGRDLAGQEGRQWSMAMTHAADGAWLKGFPFQLEAAPLSVRRDAPAIGADTARVLMEVAGYSAAEVAALAADGVIEVAGAGAA